MVSQRERGPSLSEGFLRQLGLGDGDFQHGGNKNRATSQRRTRSEDRGGQQERKLGAKGKILHRINPRSTTQQQPSEKAGRSLPLENETDGNDEFSGLDMLGESDESEDRSDAKLYAPSNIPGRVREKLQQDEAEIADLERKLGIRGRKNLPKSFREDGLGDLLDSLGNEDNENRDDKRKRKDETEEWLQLKRRKAMSTTATDGYDSDEEQSTSQNEDESRNGEELSDDAGGELDKDNGGHNSPYKPKPKRENPYVAPVPELTSGKYVPPALRKQATAEDNDLETVRRVRRQAHHLVARLSDANMLTILAEIEKLYQNYPRQYVTDAVVDKLLEQITIEGALSNSVIILIAGFATAIYHVLGVDFGAYFVQQSTTLFCQQYCSPPDEAVSGQPRAPTSKISLNLIGLISELYNFRMIGPNLIYDYIRMLLSDFTEANTELLLRIFEASGHRLRVDDPRTLKDIVMLIQPAISRAGGEKNLSIRTQHMILRIYEIKKSEKKKARNVDSGFGYAERIRKTLGNLGNSRNLEASGSLRVGLSDIEQAGNRGKWWLVGASWVGHEEPGSDDGDRHGKRKHLENSQEGGAIATEQRGIDERKQSDDILGSWGDSIPDVDELEQLAREQGMNTNARRSIFVTLLSAADSKDAHARLLKLGLNKYDKRETANVLIRCVGSEQHYNRYYALVARQVCSSDHRMGWVFRVSLWKLFRRLGEPMFGELADEDGVDEDDEATDLRRIVNTAKMYGYLIATGCLGLDVLKCLQLIRLQAKTRMFVEVLLISLFEEIRADTKASGGGGSCMMRKRLESVGNNEDLRRGLSYFLGHVVRKSQLVPQGQASSISKACGRAQKTLDGNGADDQ